MALQAGQAPLHSGEGWGAASKVVNMAIGFTSIRRSPTPVVLCFAWPEVTVCVFLIICSPSALLTKERWNVWHLPRRCNSVRQPVAFGRSWQAHRPVPTLANSSQGPQLKRWFGNMTKRALGRSWQKLIVCKFLPIIKNWAGGGCLVGTRVHILPLVLVKKRDARVPSDLQISEKKQSYYTAN